MLTLLGSPQRYCDGVSRRGFLKVGALSFGGMNLTLADVLRAESAAVKPTANKAVINVFLGGGPPHQDMWEIKTEAPPEIRGEFKPISTKCPDIQIGECFPKIAAMMDRFAVIRSVVGAHAAGTTASSARPAGTTRRSARWGVGRAWGRCWASCTARPTRRCRRSSGWRARPATCRGPTAASPASSGRPKPPASRTAKAWPTCGWPASTATNSATASACSPASTPCAANSTAATPSAGPTPPPSGRSAC